MKKTFQNTKILFQLSIFFISFISYSLTIAQAITPSDLPWNPDPCCGGILTNGIAAVSCGVGTNFPAADRYTFGMIDIRTAVANATPGRNIVTQPMYHHPSWHIDQIGNVFGVAVDDEGFTYLTASANYPSYLFSGGSAVIQYGNIGGGPNSILAAGTVYRIDKFSGQASVFVQLPQQAFSFSHTECYGPSTNLSRNTGPALGNISYSKLHKLLYVSNWEDGRIYRINPSGLIMDSYDPFQVDNGAAGLPSDKIPFGITVSPDGSRLFFGTLYDNAELYSIDLLADGSFAGTLNINSPYDFVTGTETFHLDQSILHPTHTINSSISDLEFLPNGDLLIGERRSNTGTNFAHACNHHTSSYIVSSSGLIYNTIQNIHASQSATTTNGDDQYGGISYYKHNNGDIDYVLSSSDLLNGQGPHGIGVIPETATGSPRNVLAVIPYSPLTVSTDYKGIGGDVEVFNGCACDDLPNLCTYSCKNDPGESFGINSYDEGTDQIVHDDGRRALVGISENNGKRIHLEILDECGTPLAARYYSALLGQTDIKNPQLVFNASLNEYVVSFSAEVGDQWDIYIMPIMSGGLSAANVFGPIIDNQTDDEWVQEMIDDFDDGYVLVSNQIVSSTGEKNTIVSKVSYDMSAAWNRDININNSNNIEGFDIIETSNTIGLLSAAGPTSYVLVGKVDHQAYAIGLDWRIDPTFANVIDIDANTGSVEAAKRIKFDNGRFYIGGDRTILAPAAFDIRPWVAEIQFTPTYQASLIWSRIYDKNNENENLIDLEVDGNHIYITGQTDVPDIFPTTTAFEPKAYIASLNLTGATNWSYNYSPTIFFNPLGSRINDLDIRNGLIYTNGQCWENKPTFDPTLPFDLLYDLSRAQISGDGILTDQVCQSDFSFNSPTFLNPFQFVPAIRNAIPWLMTPIVNSMDSSPHNISCCSQAQNSCQISSTLNSVVTDSCCVISLDLFNLNPNVSKIQIDLKTPGLFFDQIVIDPGLNYSSTPSSTPTRIVLDHISGIFPLGNIYDYVSFCYGNTSTNPILQQQLEINYYDASCIKIPGCCETIMTECPVDPVDLDCFEVIPCGIECDPLLDNKFKFYFKVKNLTNPNEVLGDIRFDPQDPLVSYIPNTHTISPPINSGTTSTVQCVDIIGLPGLTFPHRFDLAFGMKDTSGLFCCNDADTLSLLLPNCCDPCVSPWVTENPILQSPDQCCHSLDIVNTCDFTLTKIITEIQTPGVTFGTSSVGAAYSSSWTLNNVGPQKFEWIPVSASSAPAGNYPGLINYCLDNFAGNVPQTVDVHYIMNDQYGQDSIACTETFVSSCDINYPCLDIKMDSIYCDSLGNYFFDFCIENTANPSFTAAQLDINFVPPVNLFCSPSTFPHINIAPGDCFCATTQIFGTSGLPNQGDIFHIKFDMHSQMQDTCCIESVDYSVQLPPCDCEPVITQVLDHTQDQEYNAAHSVNSEASVPVGNDVRYLAGEEINLTGGFSVDQGASFCADIEACCCSDDPLNELTWLIPFIGNPNFSINQCEWEGQCVFIVTDYCLVSDGVTTYYTCDGSIICEVSLGGTTCLPGFSVSNCTVLQSCI